MLDRSPVKRTPPYTIDDLTDASDESARTIRFWIQEGLLPAAEGGGRAAFYTQEHMDRLLFLARLRREASVRLPIAMMRDVLDRLYASSDPDVVRRVAHGEEPLQILPLPGMASGHVVSESRHPYDAANSGAKSVWTDMPGKSPRRSSDNAIWTTIQIRDGLELRLRSVEPGRVAWLAGVARRLRAWLQEGEH